MGILSGYDWRQKLTVSKAEASDLGGTQNVPLTKCAYIRGYSTEVDHNFGAEIYIATMETALNLFRSALEVTLPTLPTGYTLTDAEFYAYYYSKPFTDPVGRTINVQELTRTFTEGTGTAAAPAHDAVCWNHTDGTGGTHWTAIGGDGGHNGGWGDIAGVAVGATVPAGLDWMHWHILDIVNDAITNHANVVRMLMYDASEGGVGTHYAAFYSDDYVGDTTKRPYIKLTFTCTPTVKDDKVTANIHKGNKTVETSVAGWSVNGSTYHNRVPFTIQTFSELTTNTYPHRVVIDTAALVTGGFIHDGTDASAGTVEFAADDGAHDMPYWILEKTAAGVSTPRKFNTTGTPYYILPQETLAADSEYTYYLYCDALIDAASDNYDPDLLKGASGFFEHFTAAAADVAAFLAAYDGDPENSWTQIGADAPIIVVADSVLTLDGGTNLTWEGIETAFTMQNFRLLIGYQSIPESWAAAGVSNGATPSTVDSMMFHNALATANWGTYLAGVKTDIDFDPFAAGTFVAEMVKYGTKYRFPVLREDPSATGYPDKATNFNATCTDDAHKVFIATLNQGAEAIDWVLCIAEVEKPPRITFPDITYDKIGTVFCNNLFSGGVSGTEPWYNELAFANSSGGPTKLYWERDELAQLSRQPGNSIKVTIHLGAPITADTFLYCYFDQPGAVGTPAECDPSHVYGDSPLSSPESYRWQPMDGEADFTEKVGSWAAPTVISKATTSKGYVGNVGGGAGRLWNRFSTCVKWDTDEYYHVSNPTDWELGAAAWPVPFTGMVSLSTSPEGETTPLYPFHPLPITDLKQGPWPHMSRVEGVGAAKKLYVSWALDGFRVVYTDDPSDPDSWVVNPNGPFLTAAWITAADGAHFPAASGAMVGNILKHINTRTANTIAFVSASKHITDSGNLLIQFKVGDTIVVTGTDLNDGTYTVTASAAGTLDVAEAVVDELAGAATITTSKWFCMITGVVPNYGHLAYAYNHEEPENWTVAGWHYGGMLIDEAAADENEDDDMVYDSVNDKFYWYMVDVGATDDVVHYVLNNATTPFPGVEGDWGAAVEFAFDKPIPNKGFRSPRVMVDDDGDFVLHITALPFAETLTYPDTWVVNHTYVGKSTTTPAANFVRANTQNVYKQATATGLNLAYITNSNLTEGALSVDGMLGQSGLKSLGVLFRYNSVTGNGFLATMNYNSAAPKVQLFPVALDALGTELGTSYNIPQFPNPWLTPGYWAQIKVAFFGASVKVWYSLWGNEWVLSHDVTLTAGSLYQGAKYGLGTNLAEAYFKNMRVWDYSDTPPEISSAGEYTSMIVGGGGSSVGKLVGAGII